MRRQAATVTPPTTSRALNPRWAYETSSAIIPSTEAQLSIPWRYSNPETDIILRRPYTEHTRRTLIGAIGISTRSMPRTNTKRALRTVKSSIPASGHQQDHKNAIVVRNISWIHHRYRHTRRSLIERPRAAPILHCRAQSSGLQDPHIG